MSKYVLIIFYSLLLISCDKNELIKDPTTYEYDNCNFIADEISDYDLFQNYFILKLNFSYMPDIIRLDTLMNDYYYLKIKNKNINGTYKITDTNVRYKLNKVVPYDNISKKEYPFTISLYNKEVCVFLDLQNAESCECN
jgi:hypothetical protein